ncbi:hypothetical protein TNCV_2319301 [Trichonephila clavipes]|nr:hypothetical protein TNCV_2319301 [Trichonephila clavipes]
MDEDRDFEFYVFKPKETKPIKVVVKGLPGCTKPNEIVSDLEDQVQSSRIQSYSYFQPPRTPLVLHVVATPLKPPNQVQQHKAPLDSRYGMEESA